MSENLNKIVTSWFSLLDDAPTYKDSNSLQHWINILTSEGAYEILIPSPSHPLDVPIIESYIDNLPFSMKNKIKLIDQDKKIAKKIDRFLEPIYENCEINKGIYFYDDCKDFLPTSSTYNKKLHQKWGIFYEKRPKYLMNYFTFRPLPPLRNYLYKLTLASKYKAEVDIECFSMINDICDRFILETKDDEAIFRLNEVKSLINIYKPEIIDNFHISQQITKKSIHERLLDMFDESEMYTISKTRHSFGLLGTSKYKIFELKKCVRKMVNNKNYQQYLSSSQMLINIFPNASNIDENLDITMKIFSKSYNPPVVNLDDLRTKICNTNNCRLISSGVY